tara:strand:+ start:263 stop:478 length:216 start_codon:yes stop_codon:yes gene_type:complete
MADITMCNGKGCTMTETCYRFKAPKGYYQAFFTESPNDNKVDDDNNTICQYYWETDKLRGAKYRGINVKGK